MELDEKSPIIPYMLIELYISYLNVFFIEKEFERQKLLLGLKIYDGFYSHHIKELSKKLPVFVSGFFTLTGTNFGVNYSRSSIKETPYLISLSVLPTSYGTLVQMSYLNDQKEEIHEFINNFKEMSAEIFEQFLTDIIIRNNENFYIEENYWNDFDRKDELLDFFYKTINNNSFQPNAKLNLFKDV